MLKLSRRTLTLTLVALVAIAAVATTALAANAAKTATSTYPPCTKAALSAGIRRGPAALRQGRLTKPFACARNWAYSGGLVGHGRQEVEVTVLYRAVGRRWQTSSRVGPCRSHAVPKKIYKPACLTN